MMSCLFATISFSQKLFKVDRTKSAKTAVAKSKANNSTAPPKTLSAPKTGTTSTAGQTTAKVKKAGSKKTSKKKKKAKRDLLVLINGTDSELSIINSVGGIRHFDFASNADHLSYMYFDKDGNMLEDDPDWCHFSLNEDNSFNLTFDQNHTNNKRFVIFVLFTDDDGFPPSAYADILICQNSSEDAWIPPFSNSYHPFDIIDCSVGNTDKNNRVIDEFGSTIYSYRTNYLKPRLKIKSSKSGDFLIYYKLFNPNGSLSTGTSSPSGYSTSYTISVHPGLDDYDLTGWGSDTNGHWKAGEYIYEFYCNQQHLGSYKFTIK